MCCECRFIAQSLYNQIVTDLCDRYFARLTKAFKGLFASSLRGKPSKGKGKGITARDHARGRREEGNACKEAIVFAIPPTN